MAPRQSPPSLDLEGITAAVYPDETTLWAVGPPINDPGAQLGNQTVYGTDSGDRYGAPLPTAQSQAETEDLLHAQLNDETPNVASALEWVNPAVTMPPNFGAWNEQWFESGHTQAIPSNPSAEQGWGVGPARRWARWPFSELTNPFRNRMVHMRNGELPWVYADTALYWRTQEEWQQQWDGVKFRSPVAPVVGVPASVPFVATVPAYGGGPAPTYGLDIPFDESMLAGGVYPSP